MSNGGSQYLRHMFAILRYRYATQAVKPTRHWWQCPRGLAWFQVLMIWSLVKPSACAEPLSRIGLLYAPLLAPVVSRNLLLYQSLPTSIHHWYAKMRRRKDDTGLGTAARRIVA